MPAFKEPSFQDRVATAGKSKQKALDQLMARPRVDEALMTERREAREVREQALAEERAAKATAKAEKTAIKAADLAEAEAAAALKAVRLKPAGAAEMKAARDARYAARTARK